MTDKTIIDGVNVSGCTRYCADKENAQLLKVNIYALKEITVIQKEF